MNKLSKVRTIITSIWLGCSAIIFIILLIKTIGFNKHATYVWSWYSTNVVPGISIIIGLWMAAMHKNIAESHVVSTSSKVAVSLTIFYFITLFLTLILRPMAGTLPLEEYMHLTQTWLIVIQAPTLAFIAKIFAEESSNKVS